MKAILRFLQREAVWPWLVLALGAAILLPRLGSYGFWEPHEIRIADQARKLGEEPVGEDDAGELTQRVRPPLTEWSIARGIEHISADELGARMPLALLGLAALMATFFLGRRLASPRAGLLAALTLLAFPLFLLQSRQLISNIGAVTGSALAVLGLVGLAWPAGHRNKRRPIWLYALDVALIIAGMAISYYAAAALLGLVVPFGAIALTCLAGWRAAPEAGTESGSGSAQVAHAEPPAMHREARVASRQPLFAGLAVLVAGLGLTIGGPFLASSRMGQIGLAVTTLGMLLVLRGLMHGRTSSQAVLGAEARRVRWHLALVGTLAGLVTVAALAVVFQQIFDLGGRIPGQRALLGHSIVPANQPSPALGGIWRMNGDAEATFDVLFEQIAYGMFPWTALAPIAILQLALTSGRRGRRAFAGLVPFAWALLAWIVSAVMARKVGMVLYPALVAVAVAIGMWLDDFLTARASASGDTGASDKAPGPTASMSLQLPVIAVFVALGAMVLGKDLLAFPDKMASLTVQDAAVKYPVDLTVLGIKAKAWFLALGLLFGAALGGSLWLWHQGASQRPGEQGRARALLLLASRYGIPAALGIGLLIGLFVVHGWIPAMSRKLSSRHIFQVYRDLRDSGDRLGIMGDPGSGATYYAGGEYEKLANRQGLLTFLGRPERVFALAPATELCAIHRSIQGKGDQKYYVLDDSNAKFLLLSNQLEAGESDRNPLAQAIVRERPTNIQTPLQVTYDDRIELIGVNMPTEVGRGDSFQMTLIFRVLKQVSGNWKIFVHFDGGSLRFQGDHGPIGDRCGTGYWQPGDYIVDTFTVEAGNVTYPKTTYSVLVGFFRGSHGNWTNMPVTGAKGPEGQTLSADPSHRVRIGQIRVR